MSYNPDYVLRKLQELPRERGVKVLPGQARAFMRCQWHRRPDGDLEKTPSFIVHIAYHPRYQPGSGKCFACGKRIKDFRVVLDPSKEGFIEGETEDTEDLQVHRIHSEAVERRLYGQGEDQDPYDLQSAMPWLAQESWRTIPGTMMQEISAKTIFDPDFRLLMAYLPVYVHSEHVGGIRARLNKKRGETSYYNTKGEWAREVGLFPFDTTLKYLKNTYSKTLLLVEGPRDALRCLSLGLPAVSVLGTGNWSETKAEHIFNIGIKTIVTAFDPDEPGLKLTKEVFSAFRSELTVYRFDFARYLTIDRQKGYTGPDYDPGNMPEPVALRLKSLVEKVSA